MPNTVAGIHLGLDIHASRPAANTVPDGSQYSCSTHGLIYKSNYAGNSWATWATLGGSPDLDAIIAASAGQDIADALSGAAAPDAGNVFATIADVGSGGADLVQVAAGAGSIRLPGLNVFDRVPGSPNAADDEFDTTSTFSTVLGTLNTNNVSDIASHLHLVKTTSGTQIDGVYKTAPSVPYTVSCKMSGYYWSGQYHWPGLMIGDATPTAWYTYGPLFTTASRFMDVSQWTNRTTRGSFTDVTLPTETFGPSLWLKMVVTSGSNVTCSYSRDGVIWIPTHVGAASGLTPSKVGLFVTAFSANLMEAAFDWVRFS